MAKKTSKKTQSSGEVEAKVVALAEQLGWFLGTVRGKADSLLTSDAVRQEVARIRDGAADLMEHVSRAGASATQTAAGATKSARNVAATVGTTAMNAVAIASTSAKQAVASASSSARKAVASAGTAANKANDAAKKASNGAAKNGATKNPVVVTVAKKRSGNVDAPGKRHRKPPPQEKVDKRMGEPAGKQMGQKQFQPGHGARRG